ncbi:MAG: hypothetical protein HZY79_01850 [Rhodoblastus sp.]|nr:MAG: hypothetical protein HZY79_01850 [Rhodoblastus sp.]
MRHALALAAVFAAAPALAADLPKTKSAPAATAPSLACLETRGISNDAFGFASGSDVNDLGQRTAAVEYDGAFGAKFGTAWSHLGKTQVEFSPIRCLDMTAWATGAWSRSKDDLGGVVSRSRVFGVGYETKYKILGRDLHGVGLTVSFEPSAAFGRLRSYDPSIPAATRWSQRAYTGTAKIILDKELIRDRLWGAFNVENAATFTRANLNDCATNSGSGYCKGSSLNLRAALAFKLADGLFMGVDGSHQRVYDGAFLNRHPGYAWFAGPNLLWQIRDGMALSAAWSQQLSGKAPGQAGGRLNLDQFSRTVVKTKLAVDF